VSRIAQLRQSIDTARRMTLGLIEDIPDDQWTYQPFAGANHVAFNLLHLLVSSDWGPTALGDPAHPWVDLFEGVLKQGPLVDRASYPPKEVLLEALAAAQARFTGLLDRLRDEDLDRPTTGAIAEYAPTLGAVLDSHVWHEGFHCGEIAVIRKALGLGPRFG
jgi:DinB superfamily